MAATTTTTLTEPPTSSLATPTRDIPTPQTAAPSKQLLNFDEDGIPTYKVPTFATPQEEREWSKAQVAGAFRVFSRLGYADGGAGHISLRGKQDGPHYLQSVAHLLTYSSLVRRSSQPASFLAQ